MIDIDYATKRIKGTLVLSDVTMKVARGTTVGLSGVNGSGKTMLLRAIAGLIGLTEGTISVDGQIIGRDRAFPPSIGLLIENPAFLDAYTGRTNLNMLASVGFRVKGVGSAARAEADQLACCALEAVGLDPDDKRRFRKYSLGMKQRLGLAAAIMEQPDLIVLDEPTNALDEEGVALIEALVDRQRLRGATIMIASHDADFLNKLADETYYLKEGRVVGHVVHRASDATCDEGIRKTTCEEVKAV